MTFLTLQDQLRDHIRARIRRRELTGSGLARAAGFPQGHLSNFLNARRGLSLESMDRLLETLGIEVLDLVSAEDVQRRSPQRAPEQGEEAVALVALENAARARFASEDVLETRVFSKAFLRKLRVRNDNDRADWLRFVVVKLDIASAREIFPLPIGGATLLLDRHYSSLLPYRHTQPNLYAVSINGRCKMGYVSFLENNLVLRTRALRQELESVRVQPGRSYSQYIIGRVCHVALEV
jgi:transcriptional regulator with XRE-family HTH domain